MSDAFEPLDDEDDDFFLQSALPSRAKELPFCPNLSVSADFMKLLHFCEGLTQDEALRSIVANLVLAHRQGVAFIFYSRDNNYYAKGGNVFPKWCSRRRVIAALKSGTAAGLLVDEPAEPQVSPVARFRSRVSLSHTARDKLAALDLQAFLIFTAPDVLVRDRETKKPIDRLLQFELSVRPEFQNVQSCAQRYNAFVEGVQIDLDALAGSLDPILALTIGRTKLTRIFIGDLTLGGRFYGSTIQRLPQAVRKTLTVNGEPVVELDFQALHYRLLMVLRGRPDPLRGAVRDQTLDPFKRVAWPRLKRSLIKLAFNIMINARDRDSARDALATKIRTTSGCKHASARRMAERAMKRLETRLPECKAYWCSDLGIRLQRIDSDICADVLDIMTSLGIPTFPVHDSFIVSASKHVELEKAMRDALLRCFERISAGSYLEVNHLSKGAILDLTF